MTFWEHVEVFRKVVFRCLAVWLVCAIAAFCFKDALFSVLFAPSTSDFILYRGLCWLAERLSMPALCPGDFAIEFINIELASQFTTHLQVAVIMGVLVAFPYLIIQLYGFICHGRIAQLFCDIPLRFSFLEYLSSARCCGQSNCAKVVYINTIGIVFVAGYIV